MLFDISWLISIPNNKYFLYLLFAVQSYSQIPLTLSENKTISIVIPAYNEERRIRPVLEEICNYIQSNELPWTVIISIDGNDSTDLVVESMKTDFPFLYYIKNSGRNGKGGAIKRAVNIASGEFIILMDADNAIPFGSIVSQLNWTDEYKFINFDRYKRKENRIPLLRRLVSRGYNLYAKFLLGLDINDTQCGYKIIEKSLAIQLFNRLTITNGFFYSPLFFYVKKLGISVLEVPVRYKHIDGSKFKVSSMILGGFLSTLFFRIRNSPFKNLIPKKLISLYYKKFRWI